ncbi:hypothetical protein [Aliivibrio wodanis]|uniref:hypothetical protein n=1 Tax=Aliivibrio wodanis TaxID=80852 RepID=UPI00406C0E99
MKNSFIFVGALLLIGVSVNYLEQILRIVALIAIAAILLAVVVGFVFLSFNYIKRDKAPSPDATAKEKREDEPLTDRRVMALYKLAQQVLDDDAVDIDEAEKLRSWFRRYPESADDHRTMHLFGFVEEVLTDKKTR